MNKEEMSKERTFDFDVPSATEMEVLAVRKAIIRVCRDFVTVIYSYTGKAEATDCTGRTETKERDYFGNTIIKRSAITSIQMRRDHYYGENSWTIRLEYGSEYESFIINDMDRAAECLKYLKSWLRNTKPDFQ